MIHFYGGFRGEESLHLLRDVLNELLPQSKSSLIESGTVLISNGDILEYSIDRDDATNSLHFSANFHGKENDLQNFLPKLMDAFRLKGIVYSLEYEVEKDGEFTTHVVKEKNIN